MAVDFLDVIRYGAIIIILCCFYFCSIILTGNILNEEYSKFKILLAAIFNSILSFYLFLHLTVITFFPAMFTILLVEIVFLSRRQLWSCLFITSAFLFNIMNLNGLVFSAYSWMTNSSIYSVADNKLSYIHGTIISLVTMVVFLFCLIMFIKKSWLQSIVEQNVQRNYMIAWMCLGCFYSLYSSYIYTVNYDLPFLYQNQTLVFLTILCADYLFLFFMFKINALRSYEVQNKELGEELEKQEKYRNHMVHNATQYYEVDLSNDKIILASETHLKLLEKLNNSYSEVIKYLADNTVHPDDKGSFLEFADRVNLVNLSTDDGLSTHFEYRSLKNGKYMWYDLIVNTVRNSTGTVTAFAYILDITDRKSHEQELLNQAQLDMFTGLYNKSSCEGLITERLKYTKGTLFIMDIDNFKTINDRLSHRTGDDVLKHLSQTLKLIFRETDIIGRVGGDEFMVFMPDNTDISIAEKKADQICKEFCKRYTNDKGEDLLVTLSIGGICITQSGCEFDTVYEKADAELYRVKRTTKNAYKIGVL